MKNLFLMIQDQLKFLNDLSLKNEISGDAYSKLLIIIWKMKNDTVFPYSFGDPNIAHNIILIEYLIQSQSVISLPHDYNFRNKQVLGYNTPINKLHEKLLYVEIKRKDSDFKLDCFYSNTKNEGVGDGYTYQILDFRIYCKELFVESDFYLDSKKEQIKIYLESLKPNKSNAIEQRINYNSAEINHFNEYFDISKEYNMNQSKSRNDWVYINFNSKNCEYQKERIQKILNQYINPYAESLSYILLYYLGFMPSLNVIKSIVNNKIYLMVDQVPAIDEEFGSYYCFGTDLFINPSEFHGKKLNNVCASFHTFSIFNYLFHLGDFHDGNYAICTREDKFKILIFDLWMSPVQIRVDDVINFSRNSSYDIYHHCNSSLAYYLLFFDNMQNIGEDSNFSISRLISSLQGENRLPFITTKSLKIIFSSALKNLTKIFNSENPKGKLYSRLVAYNQNSQEKTPLSANFLIEKIYDSSREILLKNPFLIDDFMDYISIEDYQLYYPVDEEDRNFFIKQEVNSHGYLVKFSTQKLTILLEKLLEIPKMDMIFIQKPSNYLVYGDKDLIIEHKKYKKSFSQSPFSDFIRKPSNIDWIFVFFSVDQKITSFFDDSIFSETKDLIIHQKLSKDEKCLFIVFNDIILCDLYRIHLFNLNFVQFSVSDEYNDSLLFSYRNSMKEQ